MPHGFLTDPTDFRDACGVGFLARIDGRQTHGLLDQSISALGRLTHRGGVNADRATGDGAGILTQIPRKFFRREIARHGVDLSPEAMFGVGMMFLPRGDMGVVKRFKQITEEVVRECGMEVLLWREAPTHRDVLGELALSTMPWFEQVIFSARADHNVDSFQRDCYRMRRIISNRAVREGIRDFSICSMSGETIVYKGLFVGPQMREFWIDLQDPDFETAIAIIHQRYSTNTLPNWHLAQPFRRLAHNGEINTLRGNLSWMRAREADLHIPGWEKQLPEILPIVENEKGSDSCCLDNAFEFLSLSGRDILHAMMMLVPEDHEQNPDLSPEARAFYEYHAGMMEPWDGPAALAFTDGRIVGAALDRNGLRPARYKITDDGLVILGSEVGLLEIPDSKVIEKGRLGPGKMLAIDTYLHEVYKDAEIKSRFTHLHPYTEWVGRRLVQGAKLAVEHPEPMRHFRGRDLLQRQLTHGWQNEDVKHLIIPMVEKAQEPTGSMGDDTPLPFLSTKPRFLYEYFRQRFAQVTNPAIDPIRERSVMSLETLLGPRLNVAEETEEHIALARFPSPILGRDEMAWLRYSEDHELKVSTIHATFAVAGGAKALDEGLKRLCRAAELAVREGTTCLIVSNVEVNEWEAPISTLLAVGAVHQQLLRKGLRMRTSIVAETGGAKAVHNIACLIGQGANAVCPTLAFDAIEEMCDEGVFGDMDFLQATERYYKAVNKGLLKIMSKMGISTISSYCGAQIFEAVGISQEIIDRCFAGTPSLIGGIGLEELAHLSGQLHQEAYPEPVVDTLQDLGLYRYSKKGEHHGFNPAMRKDLHRAVQGGEMKDYRTYVETVRAFPKAAIRDLLEIVEAPTPIPVEEVEAAEAIMRRFSTAAMSLGALSPEAHETLAVAMNRIGGRSNSGEGGEDPLRFVTEESGDSRCSKIKQVASGRFGVVPTYLLSAEQLEIKIAQGAKPGEGGQLPAFKVSEYIAKLRHTQPGTMLISPPPHHDIYSIEDLAQLIFDLKHFNARARVSVKLVAEQGVGTIAAGVAKAGADIIHIAGHEGGTGASPLSSIKHAGNAWELGLAETQQALIFNNLRERVTLRTDGGLKTGRDLIIAACLGADEFCFGTIALIAEGCVMARQCHMNNCPVGVATQRDDLRRKFPGAPEHVVRYFQFVAEEMREFLAKMGKRTLDEVIGRTEMLRSIVAEIDDIPRAKNISLDRILADPDPSGKRPRHNTWQRNDRVCATLDEELIEKAKGAIRWKEPVAFETKVQNIHLTTGARLAAEITRAHGEHGLAPGTIAITLRGSAGQSFGAFGVDGMRMDLIGEANDYVGKGLAGGEIIVRPDPGALFNSSMSSLVGNTCLYGATGGALYVSGQAGERFGVRNSGATAVVEGAGDHCCEYMTGGHIIVLGPVGRNMGAGMTGGIAHVWDPNDRLVPHLNRQLVTSGPVTDDEEAKILHALVERHHELTRSLLSERLLGDWAHEISNFKRVAPKPVEPTPDPGLPQKLKEKAASASSQS